MNKVFLYLFLQQKNIDRPLSRALRARAAALYFGNKNFEFAPEDGIEKPRLLVPEKTYFNATHTKNLYLCAFAGCEIGIDAEEYSGTKEYLSIAKRFFSFEENEQLSQVRTTAEQRRLFFLLWTKKEAAAKFSGAGLREVIAPKERELFFRDLTPEFEIAGLSDRFVGHLAAKQPVQISLFPASLKE